MFALGLGTSLSSRQTWSTTWTMCCPWTRAATKGVEPMARIEPEVCYALPTTMGLSFGFMSITLLAFSAHVCRISKA